MIDDIEPLTAALWFSRIEKIARGELRGVENSLRHAAHLLQLTPKVFRCGEQSLFDEDAFEELLGKGDFDSASLRLVAPPRALTLHHDLGAPIRAAISCTILNRTISRSGETVATAVLNAWTQTLLGLSNELGKDLRDLPRQSLGLH